MHTGGVAELGEVAAGWPHPSASPSTVHRLLDLRASRRRLVQLGEPCGKARAHSEAVKRQVVQRGRIAHAGLLESPRGGFRFESARSTTGSASSLLGGSTRIRSVGEEPSAELLEGLRW